MRSFLVPWLRVPIQFGWQDCTSDLVGRNICGYPGGQCSPFSIRVERNRSSTDLSTLAPAERPEIREHLNRQLGLTRARGWAFDDQEFKPGIAGIVAPFFSRNGRVLRDVGIWAPVDRVYKHKDELVRRVPATSLEATSTLGATQ